MFASLTVGSGFVPYCPGLSALFWFFVIFVFFVFFFFSSRRRHTRSLCDWSSDVCSSDLSRLGAERCRRSRLWMAPARARPVETQRAHAKTPCCRAALITARADVMPA